MNTEANAKVVDLNQRTMNALETLAFLYSTFEKARKDLNKEVELFHKDFQEMQEAMSKVMEAQRFTEIAQEQVCDRRERYRRLSVECAAAEECLNEGLECISELVRDAAADTQSLSCRTPTTGTAMN